MPATYTWTFPQFDVAPTADGLDNVVKGIHWRLDGVDGTFRSGAYGSVAVDAPDPNSFVPYSQITPQWAIDTVSAKINVAEVTQAIENQIAAQKNPPVLPMVPPFAALQPS